MKLLWVSNHPESKSGYGGQTRQVGLRLGAAGHEVIFAANDGQRGVAHWNGSTVLGMGLDRYARDVIADHVERLRPDWAISLYDAWTYLEGGRRDPFEGIRTAGWFPVDHVDVNPLIVQWARSHLPIAMSQFGRDQMAEKGVVTRYVPHAVEPVFHPTDPAPVRALMRVPEDAFLVSIVSANTGSLSFDRKAWGEMLQAYAAFAARHDDVYLYLHTLEMGAQGLPLPMLLNALRVRPDRVRWADQWALKMGVIRDEDMAAIYSSTDVLLMTSRGEGFGIPALESLAAGTPIIVSDFTAQPELLGAPWTDGNRGLVRHPAGWTVSCQKVWNGSLSGWFGTPRLDEIVDALEDAYAHRGDEAMKAAALARAAEYDADTVFERDWKPVLAEMADELERPNRARQRKERAETPGLNREQRRAAKRSRVA